MAFRFAAASDNPTLCPPSEWAALLRASEIRCWRFRCPVLGVAAVG